MNQNRKLCVALVVALLVFGGITALYGWQQYDRRRVLSQPPVRMRLGDLLKNGIGRNRHVEVTDFRFGDRWAIETRNGNATKVWIPVFPINTPPGKLLFDAVVESESIGDDVQAQQAFAQKQTIRGICSAGPAWLGTHGNKVFDAYPGVKAHDVWRIEAGLVTPSSEQVQWTCGAAIVLTALGILGSVALVLWHWAARQHVHANAEMAGDTVERNREKLGPRIAEYRAGSGWLIATVILEVIAALSAAGFAVMLLLRKNNTPSFVMGVFFAAVACGLVVVLLATIRRFRRRVCVHFNGLAVYAAAAEKSKILNAVLWESICYFGEHPRFLRNIQIGHDVLLTMKSGRTMRMPAIYQDFRLLADTIRDQSYSFRLAHAAAALQIGNAVEFLHLRVWRDRLERGRSILKWSDVASVTIEQTSDGQQLTVREVGKKSAWYATPPSFFPNADVLVALAEKLMSQQGTV